MRPVNGVLKLHIGYEHSVNCPCEFSLVRHRPQTCGSNLRAITVSPNSILNGFLVSEFVLIRYVNSHIKNVLRWNGKLYKINML